MRTSAEMVEALHQLGERTLSENGRQVIAEAAVRIERLAADLKDARQSAADWCATADEAARAEIAMRARVAELERRITEHDEGCRDICGRGDQQAVRCGYRPYFVNSRRRCPECPMDDIIGLPDADGERDGT